MNQLATAANTPVWRKALAGIENFRWRNLGTPISSTGNTPATMPNGTNLAQPEMKKAYDAAGLDSVGGSWWT
jgi:hypothetical protein